MAIYNGGMIIAKASENSVRFYDFNNTWGFQRNVSGNPKKKMEEKIKIGWKAQRTNELNGNFFKSASISNFQHFGIKFDFE